MQNQLNEIWEETLSIIKKGLNTPMSKAWFDNTSPLAIQNDILIISTPNSFIREWLETRYSQTLKEIVSNIIGKNLDIKFVLNEETKNNPPLKKFTQTADAPSIKNPSLNSRYIFDNFVMGSSNRFAQAAALAVAEQPFKAYNPLFIYGGVGLGKTHLLQAIGHYIHQHNKGLKVQYVSTEKFTNDFISSIGDKGKIAGFHQKYRKVDILLVDDIQFIAGKEATQEEFFHTFNNLYEANKQIVISSDRPPKDISTLEDRLRSRFVCGLITDIQPPDLETRIAILQKKAHLYQEATVPFEVMEFIASRIQSNIRELEGALTRVVAFSSLTKCPINVKLSEDVLKDIFSNKESRPISIQTIQNEVCRYFNISKIELVGSRRTQSIVYPRQIAMYLSRELTDLSLPKIGEEFGGRDHTTVMHANVKIEKLINEKRDVYNQVQELINKIKQKQ
ncbi:chromosomal replication initiator protein DnaA [Candidatus Oleimmundimicrobium sp.]|uniref:chromosomal replication initiator protein DnaA n=1 Tax=Candidatus Oleimmundimicrobium sp. TaxID=3060597 RepID=UPI00271D051F|nr:chromosomal replication initiator protein DnaA [Candidatus Oleimmundimicrobium sp.]MDO8886380.1 chromosomal replication initiator protein DnaA [Candidatus Oleimmundimicrobium sp.]